MSEIQNKKYDLEERTLSFARNCRGLIKNVDKTIGNIEDGKQLVRSSGSVAANYIEANESLSKKDFALRIKICRKEAKESILWLKLLEMNEASAPNQLRMKLTQEGTELMKIFGAIIEKTKSAI
jgi:four helix bundle protein